MFFQHLINVKTMNEIIYSLLYKVFEIQCVFTLTEYLNSFQMLSSHVTSGYHFGLWVLNNEKSRAFAIERKLKETYDSIVFIKSFASGIGKNVKSTENFLFGLYLRLLKFKYYSRACPI